MIRIAIYFTATAAIAAPAHANPVWEDTNNNNASAASLPAPAASFSAASNRDYGYSQLAKPAFAGAPTIPAGLAKALNDMANNLASPATQAALAKAGYKSNPAATHAGKPSKH